MAKLYSVRSRQRSHRWPCKFTVVMDTARNTMVERYFRDAKVTEIYEGTSGNSAPGHCSLSAVSWTFSEKIMLNLVVCLKQVPW